MRENIASDEGKCNCR